MWISNFVLELLFPKYCRNCQREGSYLCQDCFSLIDFLPYYPQRFENLAGIFAACPYQNFIIKRLITQFKYKPYVKELAKTLASLIIHQLRLTENPIVKIGQGLIIPIPLAKKRLKERGFNQAEEIGKELSEFLKIPLANNVLFKIKETLPQVELSGKEREKNVKNAFVVANADLIKEKKILLLDDVFTTGATLNEAARVLKEAGAKQVWGITVARE